MRFVLGLAVCIAASVEAQTPRARFAALADSLVGDAQFRSAHWGVLVVDPATGDTLYSRNAGKLFMPASNMKLVTGAVALAQLGPAFRFTTRLLGARPDGRGVVRGPLVVIGTGDPSFSDSLNAGGAMLPLHGLAETLRARGVKRITGGLVSAGNAFPDSTLGYGWAWDDLDYDYGAPVDELVFNEGWARITIHGGARAGDAVRVARAPARGTPRLGNVEVTTIPCCDSLSRVEWFTSVREGHPSVALRGSVRANDSVVVRVALRDPTAAWLDAFGEALDSAGIRFAGMTAAGGTPTIGRITTAVDTTGMVELARRESPPLRAILAAFEKPSQNQIGEILFKTLGRVATGAGIADSARRVVESQLVAWGADPAGFAIRDGSGLSRHDYLSPETIVRVLDAMRRHEHSVAFRDALPIAGVDGTLRTRMRGTSAAGNVRAKTGTIDKARALSGYVTTADGRLLLFSMLANNHVVPNREVERVQDALLVFLASSQGLVP